MQSAISSTVAMRPSDAFMMMRSRAAAASALFRAFAVDRGVSVKPGAMALMRIPRGP